MGGQRGRELLDYAPVGGGAALQRLEGQPPLAPHDNFAVEDQPVRQLRGRGDEIGKVQLNQAPCRDCSSTNPPGPAGVNSSAL